MASLRVEATLDALSPIGAFVMQAAEEAGLDKRAAYRLRLAVDEIATNVVLHGRPGERGAHAMVDLSSRIDERSLTIVLEDAGPAFNPLEHGVPEDGDLERPMEERPIGGLGVFLALRGVDQFRYERVDTVNRNVFVVNRQPAPLSESR